MLQNPQTPSLIYAADPMCSWCYAFEPEVGRVAEVTQLPIRLVMGGLFVGDRAPLLDDRLRRYLRDTWARVAASSGQPVSFEFLEREGWIYDTEPPCRAVVAVRQTEPALAPAFFRRLQQAFYAEGIDITDPAVYGGLAEEVGIDTARFRDALHHPDLPELTRADFAEATRLGAQGFPTLLLDTGDEQLTVSAGYNRADQVLRTIDVFR